MSYWYLATPYSKYPDGIEAAFLLACETSALLIRAGVPVFSPIAHTHPIAILGDLDPFDHDIWMPLDTPMMDAAYGLIFVLAEGWLRSYGMSVEWARFLAAGKPIVFLDPGEPPEIIVSKL